MSEENIPNLVSVIRAMEASTARNRALDADVQICLHRAAGRLSERMKADFHAQGMFYYETGPYSDDGDPAECGLASAADFTSHDTVRAQALEMLRQISPSTKDQ